MPIARPRQPVDLEGFELRVLQIPLVSPFTTSFGTETVREVIVVRALTADGEGWGEIVTGAAPLYSSEYTQSAWDVALRWLVPALLDRQHARRRRGRRRSLEPFIGHRMAKAGLELAVLDAALRAEGRPLGEYLGAVHDRVPSGVSVGIQRDPAALVEVVRGYLDEGYVRIKIKIKPGRDVAETAAVRDAFGDIPLQVDANSAYTLADVDTLAELDRFDLLLIEQPLQEDDIVDHATLARHLRTPVCLDESIVSLKAARRCARAGRGIRHQHQGRPGRRLPRGGRGSTTCAARPGCRCGAAACSRPASAAPRTPPSPLCRASLCRATSRRRAGSTPATS